MPPGRNSKRSCGPVSDQICAALPSLQGRFNRVAAYTRRSTDACSPRPRHRDRQDDKQPDVPALNMRVQFR